LSASDGSDKALLGWSVATDADTILAGAPTETVDHNLQQGSAYTFSRTGPAARRQTGELRDSDGAANDLFGLSVALDAGATVVGAPIRGEVSVFFSPASPPPPPPPPPPPAAKPVLSKLAVNPRDDPPQSQIHPLSALRLTFLARDAPRSSSVVVTQ
jgi:hypothetical protein